MEVYDVRQTEIDTIDPLVPEPSAFEVDLVIQKLKSHKSQATDQIPTELIKTGGRTIHSEVHKLIISILNKKKLPEEWNESVIGLTDEKGDKTDCSNYRGMQILTTTNKILSIILLSRLTPYAKKIVGDHQC
jgi:hypothetical protein